MNKKENPVSSGHKNAVVCTNYKHCQEYKSYEELKSTNGTQWMEEYYTKIKKAVDETKGQIIVYEDKPILPLYFSTSSGKTENSEEVFSTQYPYLKSVERPYDGQSPKYTSQVVVSKSDFINNIKNKVCKADSVSYERRYRKLPVHHREGCRSWNTEEYFRPNSCTITERAKGYKSEEY